MSNPSISSLFLIMLGYHIIVICNGAAITFEQYQNLEGESFCSTRNKAAHTTICQNIAQLNGITGYQNQFLLSECSATRIALLRENGQEAPTQTEYLLQCRYEGPMVRNPRTGAYTNGYSYSRAIGRGINEPDVMEYTYSDGKAVPFANRENLLNQI